jgi:hypothetical protein
MGFRFSRRIKILPGVTVNLSRSGVSTSLGVKGAHVTIGHGQVRETVGIPGSGLSYTHVDKTHAEAPGAAQSVPEADPLPKDRAWRGWLWIMLVLIIAAVLLMTSCATPPLATDQRPSYVQRYQECTSLIKQRTAALVANDWPQLERLAKLYLQECTGVHPSESLANAQEDLAVAYDRLDNQMAVLAATERCIEIFYATPRCHVQRAWALVKLGRQQDARAAFAIADKVVSHAITTTETDLQRAGDPSRRELDAANLQKYRALAAQVDVIRPLFSQ